MLYSLEPQPTGPAHREPRLHNKGRHRDEKLAHHSEAQPALVASRESPCKATKTQPAKNKYTKFKDKIKRGPKVIPHVKKT